MAIAVGMPRANRLEIPVLITTLRLSEVIVAAMAVGCQPAKRGRRDLMKFASTSSNQVTNQQSEARRYRSPKHDEQEEQLGT